MSYSSKLIRDQNLNLLDDETCVVEIKIICNRRIPEKCTNELSGHVKFFVNLGKSIVSFFALDGK